MHAEIYRGLSFAEYLDIDAVNQSRLRPFAKSLRAGVWAEQNRQPATPAMQFGTAAHTLMLDGEDAFFAGYNRGGPINPTTDKAYGRDTKKFTDWLAEQPAGKPYLTDEEYARVRAIAASIDAHRWAGPIMREPDAMRELTIVWTETVNGTEVRCKARLDYYHPDHGVIDLKTTADTLDDSFFKTAARYEYHTQAAWYLLAAKRAGLNDTKYGWLAIESTPPHEVGMFAAPAFVIDCGRVRAQQALSRYANWTTGIVDIADGDTGWRDLSLPVWAHESEEALNSLEGNL